MEKKLNGFVHEISVSQWERLIPDFSRMALKVREKNPAFPPAYAGDTRESVSEWLRSVPALQRWMAVWNGSPAGYAQVETIQPYLLNFLESERFTGLIFNSGLEVYELGRVFVDVELRGFHLGEALVKTVDGWVASRGGILFAVVVEGQGSALNFYEKLSWVEVGLFDGIEGVNHVLVSPSSKLTRLFGSV